MIMAFVVVVALFGLGALLGAPYVPVFSRDIPRMLDLAQVKQGETVLDLGCGDGRLLRGAAKRGARGIGYEINPLLYLVAKVACYPQRRLIDIRLGNFWGATWTEADVIYVFLIDRYMAKLDRTLRRQVTKPTRVVSYVFQIPGISAVHSNNNAWVYVYPNSGD